MACSTEPVCVGGLLWRLPSTPGSGSALGAHSIPTGRYLFSMPSILFSFRPAPLEEPLPAPRVIRVVFRMLWHL